MPMPRAVSYTHLQGEGDEGSQEPVAPPAPVAPTSAKVVYEVASGQSVYMDIYEDGSITSGGTVDGPAKKEMCIRDRSWAS